MGRANPIAVIYMLINRVNGKIYIGQTYNYEGRMSHYKSTKQRGEKYATRPIDEAIMKYGFDAFDIRILVSKETDPNIDDDYYRSDLESELIRVYDSMNPDIGYNSLLDDHHVRGFKRKSVKHKPLTKILKSDPILVYDYKDGSVCMYLGKRSFAAAIGKDRSIIARCTKNGKATSHYQAYAVDPKVRTQNAKRVIERRRKHYNANDVTRKSLVRYIEGLEAVNKFCDYWELPTINLKELR